VLTLFAAVAFMMSLRLAWRKHREETVRYAYRVATEGANEGFYMWRPIYGDREEVIDYELVDCNEKGAELYASQRKEILGSCLKTLYSGEILEHLLDLVPKVMHDGFHEDEFETVSGSMARPAWVHRKFVRVGDGIAVTLRDISERKRLEQEKSRLAERDSLTDLPNRHWLGIYLPLALEQAASKEQNLAVLFVDLDRFKSVNDTWGHSTGDKLLHAVAERMRSVLRPDDKVARFGGDEFIVLLEGLARESDAAEIAHRIGEILQEPFNIGQRECRVGASIGISLFPRDGTEAETLIRNADIAMYAVKSDARGHYRFFEQEFFAHIQHRRDTERELLQAMEADQFIVHYQPRVDALSGALVGMEALVRWAHPVRGLVYPADFMPIAESSGLIIQLGEIVMEKVCMQLAQWRSEGLCVVPVSVNASAKQFDEGRVRDLLTSHVVRYGLSASLVEIELTESTMVSNAEQVFEELTALHAIGVSVHLDDFGTGYSSLSILHKLDVDVLKVDQAFTSQLGKSEEGEILFKAIISMAKALNMRVIAEGVETLEQLRLLQRLGCDEIQGYLVSKPLPAQEIFHFHQQSGIAQFQIEDFA
jgi:diguanylate cyclase (GGDEF)-like protein